MNQFSLIFPSELVHTRNYPKMGEIVEPECPIVRCDLLLVNGKAAETFVGFPFAYLGGFPATLPNVTCALSHYVITASTVVT
jgi:hypothetical protein